MGPWVVNGVQMVQGAKCLYKENWGVGQRGIGGGGQQWRTVNQGVYSIQKAEGRDNMQAWDVGDLYPQEVTLILYTSLSISVPPPTPLSPSFASQQKLSLCPKPIFCP